MTSQSEVIRLTKLCQRQRAKIKRLQEALDDALWGAETLIPARYGPVNMPPKHRWPPATISLGGGVKHPQQAEQGWTPPHEAQTWWIRFKSWVMG